MWCFNERRCGDSRGDVVALLGRCGDLIRRRSVGFRGDVLAI
jgi:hypothetical protein